MCYKNLVLEKKVFQSFQYLLQSRMGQMQACEFITAYHEGLYDVFQLFLLNMYRVL